MESCGLAVAAEIGTLLALPAVVGLFQPGLVVLDPFLELEGKLEGGVLAEPQRVAPGTTVIAYSSVEDGKDSVLAAGAPVFVSSPALGHLATAVTQLVAAGGS